MQKQFFRVKCCVILVLCNLAFNLNSQNEVHRANNWYFGENAALDFTCPPPVSIAGCQIGHSEGSSTMSDMAGNLLFYSNGESVWDSNNNVMPNGTGLLGSISTVQGSIIVPNPASPSKYFVFTAGSSIEDQGVVGVRFSEVDMSLNGGNGDVLPATKNTFLFAPNEEKLTAVRNASRTGYWVTAQEKSTNKWYTYEVTAAGVNMTPVISITGPPARVDNSLGAKFSPDGRWLASQNVCGSGATSNANLTVYQFNNATGQITYAWSDCGTAGFKLEFSGDGSKLYAASSRIYQYDLAAGGGSGIGNDTTAVKATKTQISTANWQSNAGMQLGPDCKIYFSEGGFGFPPPPSVAGVINDPNLAGAACNLQTNYVTLTSGSFKNSNNFPNFVQSFFEYPCTDSIEVELTASDTIICAGDSVVLEAIVNNLCGYTLTWNVALTGLGPHTVYPATTTTYQVIATTATAADTAEVTIVVGGQSAGSDTTWSICNDETYDLDTMLTASANAGGSWYDQTYTPLALPVLVNTLGSNIYYYIIGSASCGDTAIYTIDKSSSVSGTVLGNDTTLCTATYLLDATTPNSTYVWNDMSTGNTLNVIAAGTYFVDILDTLSGCSVSDTVDITISAAVDAGRDSSVLVCTGTTIDLFTYIGGAPTAGGTWLDPANGAATMPLTLATAASGNYSYIVGNATCGDTAVVQLTNVGASSANFMGNDTTICITDAFTLTVVFSNSTYLWSTGNTTNMDTIINPTTLYWLEVTDTISSCSIRDTLNVTYSPLAEAGLDSTINICGDTIMDLYTLLGGTPAAGGSWLYPGGAAATMPIDFSVDPAGSYRYAVQSGACSDTSQVTVNIFSTNALSIGNDTSLCELDTLLISISLPNTTYNWNTGNTTGTQKISNPGGSYDVTITDTLSGCSVSDTVSVTFTPALNAGNDTTVILCSSEQIDLFNYLGAAAVAGGTWYTSAGGIVTMPVTPMNDSYKYVIGNGSCKDSAIVTLQVSTSGAQFSYSPLSPYAGETTVNFTNSSSPANTSIWQIDNVFASVTTDFSHVFPLSGIYSVCLISSNAVCVDTVCSEVQIFDRAFVYVPNTFSPNGDGFNDVFLPVLSGDIEKYDLFVFDRWGALIFSTNQTDKAWDGTKDGVKYPLDTYVWRIRYKKASEVDIEYLMGHVNIIR